MSQAAKSGRRWNVEERRRLRLLIAAAAPVELIAVNFQRTPRGINQQIKRLRRARHAKGKSQ
jgi:hypothetical protein